MAKEGEVVEGEGEGTVTVEVKAAPAAQEPLAPEKARELGWGEAEISKGQEMGLVAKPGEPKKEPAAEPKKEPEAAAPKKDEPAAPKAEDAYKVLTPDQERAFLAAFGEGSSERGLYFRMKSERRARQQEAAGRKAAEEEAALLKKRVAELEKKRESAEGEGLDPDAPLTLRTILAIQKAETEQAEAQRAEKERRAQAVLAVQTEQEEFVKTVHADYDDTVKLGMALLGDAANLLPERAAQDRLRILVHALQDAAKNPEKYELDGMNCAALAYEIGRMHPQHGKAKADPAKTGTSSNGAVPNGDAGLTREQLKKAAENAQRRGSSASLASGGSKKVLAVEDVDLKTVLDMSAAERLAFKKAHPAAYAKLLKG